MKKFLIFVLLFMPMTSFAASSVRVLGAKSATPGAATTTTAAKVVPAKVTTTTAKTGDTTTSRIGTVRTKTKATTGSTSNATSGSSSRFPVITPAHSYSTVTTQKPTTNTTTTTPSEVDTSEIVDRITQVLEKNYVQKSEVTEYIQSELDDPRFDAVYVTNNPNYNPASRWPNKDLPAGYVYIWVEE